MLTLTLVVAQASSATNCQPGDIAYCVEASGMFAKVNGASSRYAVRNLSNSNADTLHQFIVSGTPQWAFNDAIPPNTTRVYTVAGELSNVVGDVVVRASQPISIEVISPARWLHIPAVARPALPTPTATPRPTCDSSYPDVCIPPPPPLLNCDQILFRNFRVLPPDPHGFDADRDGIGCET